MFLSWYKMHDRNHVRISNECKSWMELNSAIIIPRPRENCMCDYHKRIPLCILCIIKTFRSLQFPAILPSPLTDADAKPEMEMSLTGINTSGMDFLPSSRVPFSPRFCGSVLLWPRDAACSKSRDTHESVIIVNGFIPRKAHLAIILPFILRLSRFLNRICISRIRKIKSFSKD